MDNREKLENKNSTRLSATCEQNDLVACNNCFIPKNREIKNLATWYSYDGNQAKQLDYIMIDHRYRNWIKKIDNNSIASAYSPMQHRALIRDIKITLKADYFKNDLNAQCPYDLAKARKAISKSKTEIENIKPDKVPIERRWNMIHNEILSILVKITPKVMIKPKIKRHLRKKQTKSTMRNTPNLGLLKLKRTS